MRVDLNADVGERDAPDGGDDLLLDAVTSASVACGGHAGSPAVMREVVRAASARGVVVGAHPSYPDRPGFGRRSMPLDAAALVDLLHAQIGALADAAAAEGAAVRYVKAHGALYNDMAVHEPLAAAVAAAVRAVGDLVVLVPAGTPAVRAVERAGLPVAREGFADRGYLPDGRLVPRSEAGAVHGDPAVVAARALDLASGAGVLAADGRRVRLAVDSICVHGDTPGAAALAAAVRRSLERAGVAVTAFAP